MHHLTRLVIAAFGLIVMILLLIGTMIVVSHYLGFFFAILLLAAMLHWHRYFLVYIMDMFWLISPDDFKEDHKPFWRKLAEPFRGGKIR